MKLLTLIITAAILVSPVTQKATAVERPAWNIEYNVSGLYTLAYHYRGAFRHCGSYSGCVVRLTGLWNLRPQWSVGGGIGYASLDPFTEESMPVYAVARYRPFKRKLNWYAETLLGGRLFANYSAGGLTAGLHIGFQALALKHFGIKVALGYDINQFAHAPWLKGYGIQGAGGATWDYDRSDIGGYATGWLQSINFSFGFVF